MRISGRKLLERRSVDKIYAVECGYDYEGSTTEFITDSKEKAEQWRDKYFEFRDPYPDDKGKYKFSKRWCSKNDKIVFGNYDYIYIVEKELNKDPYDTQRNTDSP